MREPDVHFEVYGLPGPQGSKSYVGHRGGKAILVESSKKVKPWREAVVDAALRALPRTHTPLTGPLALGVEFYLPSPKTAPKKRLLPDKQPDLSKLMRSTEDALTDAGVWGDDALVVDAVLHKRRFVAEPTLRLPHELRTIGAIISIFSLEHDDSWDDQPVWMKIQNRFIEHGFPHGLSSTVNAYRDGPTWFTLEANLTPAKARALVKTILRRQDAGEQVALAVEDSKMRLGRGPGRHDTDLAADLAGVKNLALT